MSVLVTIALGGRQSSPAGTASASNEPAPPMAETRPHAVTIHGQTLTDEYFWLREKTNPQVMDYLKAEDAYAEAMMKPTAALQDALYQEILGHIKQTDETVPYLENGYFYYSRTREGLQYPVYCRKRGSLTAAEEVILDRMSWPRASAFLSVGARAVSDDGHLLAFTVDTTGYRQYTLRVKDLRTGMLLPDRIERVDDITWATDNQTIFYVTEDAVTKRHDRFWRHRGRRRHQRTGLRREGRAVRSRMPALARQGGHPARSRRQDVDRSAVSARRSADRRTQDHRAAAAGSRIRRRPPRQPVVHPHQQGREEFSHRHRAGRESRRRSTGPSSSRIVPT